MVERKWWELYHGANQEVVLPRVCKILGSPLILDNKGSVMLERRLWICTIHSWILLSCVPWLSRKTVKSAIIVSFALYFHFLVDCRICYGSNCVPLPPKFLCWSPNPSYFRMWPFLEIAELIQDHRDRCKAYCNGILRRREIGINSKHSGNL